MPSISPLLVVEDDPLIGLSMGAALEENGYRVSLCSSASEALVELRPGSRFLALVTDIRLGDLIDGWQLAMKARVTIPDLPVLYVSGDSAHEHRVKGVPNSILLQKPFAESELVNAVRTILS